MKTPVDAVIFVGPNDVDVSHLTIESVGRYVADLGRIFVVAQSREFSHPKVITVWEGNFPFKLADMRKGGAATSRSGWYLQQLLKFYCHRVIEGLSPRYVIIDADNIFLRPVSFFDADGRILLNVGREYHKPYFQHALRLHPQLVRSMHESAITHHMALQPDLVDGLITLVEKRVPGQPFWRTFLDAVDPAHFDASGASEYELLANYMTTFHPDRLRIRKLNWTDMKLSGFSWRPRWIWSLHYHYVTVHWYRR